MKIPTCSPREDSCDRACVEIDVSTLESENSRDREISQLKSEDSCNCAIELSKLRNETSRECVRVEIELATPVGESCYTHHLLTFSRTSRNLEVKIPAAVPVSKLKSRHRIPATV